MRRLNNDVLLDEYKIPNITELVRSLRNQAVFSKIDLVDGYFQVNLKQEDRKKTAFLDSNNRLLQFTRMPQGFKNSPAIFQRGMHQILSGLVNICCFVYIDGILIFGKNDEEHDMNFKKVQERLSVYGLEINVKKSIFYQNYIDFLGYNISKNVIKPN